MAYAFSTAVGLTDWVAGSNTGAVTAITLASFTPNAGEMGVLFTFAHSTGGTSTPTFGTPATGWVQVAQAAQTSSNNSLNVWVNPNLSAGAQTPSFSVWPASSEFAWYLGVFTGHDSAATAANITDWSNFINVGGGSVGTYATTGGTNSTTLADELAVSVAVGASTGTRTGTSGSLTPASGWGADKNQAADKNTIMFLKSDVDVVAAATVPTVTWTIASSQTMSGVGLMIAFKPLTNRTTDFFQFFPLGH